jgi:hypothetical protein
MIKVIGGLLGLATAVVLGLYLGLWVMFVGGIIQAVHAFTQYDPVSATQLALGIVRVVCSSIVGWGAFFIFAAPSLALLGVD